jgi:hypothetical protein
MLLFNSDFRVKLVLLNQIAGSENVHYLQMSGSGHGLLFRRECSRRESVTRSFRDQQSPIQANVRLASAAI